MASASAIPRFLLPRLTWQGAVPRGTQLAPLRPSQLSLDRQGIHHRHQQPQQQRRAITSSAQQNAGSQQIFQAARPSPLTKSIYNALQSSITVSTAATTTPGSPHHVQQQQPFSTTAPLHRDHHFDTLKFVARLKSEGFSEEQAAAMMHVLSDVIEESIQNLTRTMVPREDAERATYTQKVDFTKLRSELLASDGTEAQLTRTSHERLSNDLAKLDSRLRDDVARTQSSVRLDLNLEKGRIREEANAQELKIKETNARIEQEVAGLRERIEGVKFSTLQWLMGFCTGTAAIILGAWRLLT